VSIGYDVVINRYGGAIAFDSEANEFTNFIVTLPSKMLANDGGGA
jgi:sensor histidine kinase regulating citrate/malate metabolism